MAAPVQDQILLGPPPKAGESHQSRWIRRSPQRDPHRIPFPLAVRDGPKVAPSHIALGGPEPIFLVENIASLAAGQHEPCHHNLSPHSGYVLFSLTKMARSASVRRETPPPSPLPPRYVQPGNLSTPCGPRSINLCDVDSQAPEVVPLVDVRRCCRCTSVNTVPFQCLFFLFFFHGRVE